MDGFAMYVCVCIYIFNLSFWRKLPVIENREGTVPQGSISSFPLSKVKTLECGQPEF